MLSFTLKACKLWRPPQLSTALDDPTAHVPEQVTPTPCVTMQKGACKLELAEFEILEGVGWSVDLFQKLSCALGMSWPH